MGPNQDKGAVSKQRTKMNPRGHPMSSLFLIWERRQAQRVSRRALAVQPRASGAMAPSGNRGSASKEPDDAVRILQNAARRKSIVSFEKGHVPTKAPTIALWT